MAIEHHIVCGDAITSGWGEAPLRFRLGHEVVIHWADLLRCAVEPIPPLWCDLLEIAGYVMAADRAFARQDRWDTEELGAGWRRSFRMRIPVRRPEFWQSNVAYSALSQLLNFLSEDDFEWDFVPLRSPDPVPTVIPISPEHAIRYERVGCFSGGLDSLAGAVQEILVEPKPVLFVNHRTTERFATVINHFRKVFQERAGSERACVLPVRVTVSQNLSHENSSRTRSFLVATLGAVTAILQGLSQFYLYENGVTGLNLPLSSEVIGARASRTTHPRVIERFTNLFTLLHGSPFEVINPFRHHTKTEVVKLIAAAGCADWIAHSWSCSHAWQQTNAVPHCGRCSQCIDRRFAILAAGQAEHDPVTRYDVELFRGPRVDGVDRSMITGYVELARRLRRMDDLELITAYPEIFRIESGPLEERNDSIRRILDLCRRHGFEVTSVLAEGIRSHAEPICMGEVPSNCLLSFFSPGENAATAPLAPVAAFVNIFRQRGQAWEVRFSGGPLRILLPEGGLKHLHVLIRNSGKTFTSCELLQEVEGPQAIAHVMTPQASLDLQAMTEYRARLSELEHEIEEARANNDVGALARAETERQAIRDALNRDLQPNGQIRALDDDVRRIQQSISKAVKRAIRNIGKDHPALSQHLKGLVRIKQENCSYLPVPALSWDTDPVSSDGGMSGVTE